MIDGRCTRAPAGLRTASSILLLCFLRAEPAVPAGLRHNGNEVPTKYLTFTHLTANEGLSQSHVNTILQDRRGFMWFATHDGLNRYDGNTFVVYKNNPGDPASLSGNFITDLLEDEQGFLWIATQTGGMSKFDPKTERFTAYRHDPGNPNSIGDGGLTSIARDAHGYLWIGMEESGLDRFDPSAGRFTHYRNDSSGRFLGRITSVIARRQGDLWFVGNRGLFHLDPRTGVITPPSGSLDGLHTDYALEDSEGNLWMLVASPTVELVRYDPRARRLKAYPLGTGAHGMINSKLMDDHGKGLWVPSSLGLYYFDHQKDRFSYRFQRDETDPDSLSDNGVVATYEDRSGQLWVGTATGGVNLLNPAQERFGAYRHHGHDESSLLSRTVYTIYGEPNGIIWIGYWPRALDRLDLRTGRVTHYLPGSKGDSSLGGGEDVNNIYQDRRGYLWVGGWGGGIVRLDERTGKFKHFRNNAESLRNGRITSIFGDRNGNLLVGTGDGAARINSTTGQSSDFWPEGLDRTKYGDGIWGIYSDRSGTIWFAIRSGQIVPAEERPNSPGDFSPVARHPLKPTNYFVLDIYEDRARTLWISAWDGLYRFNRQSETFTRYTEAQGLPSSSLGGILEDKAGKLWISTNKGLSRFDPQTGRFRNYDVSDGLQADEFSKACFQAADGEMFFGGIHGINAFYPENIRDNPYLPPVVLTSFKIRNKLVPIGPKSVLTSAIAYAKSLTLSYRDSVFSFEFAALSYANSRKNRYRYKLDPLESDWNEVDSRQRLATYTNLEPGKYVFRVQGSNSDGLWNEQGVSLPIVIMPPWWKTNWFRALCIGLSLALLWLLYRLRVRVLENRQRELERHHGEITALNERLMKAQEEERMRIAGELHDGFLQQLTSLTLRMGGVALKLPADSEGKTKIKDLQAQMIQMGTELRHLSHELHPPTLHDAGLPAALCAYCEEFSKIRGVPVSCEVDETIADLSRGAALVLYRIAQEALGNVAKHSQAKHAEVRLNRRDGNVQLFVSDDGIGFEPSDKTRTGLGLINMRERVHQLNGIFEFDSKPGLGTTVRATVPFRPIS